MSSLPTVAISDIADVNPTTSISHLAVASFVGMEDVSESFALTRTSDRDVSSSRGYTRFREGDLLFAKITPCMENGKGAHVSGLTNGIGFGSTEFHVLRARSGEPRFLAQWLQAKDLRLAAEAQMTGSAGQRRVPTDFFSRYRIPSLPIPEQRRIAEILDTLDDQIRATEQIIAKLKLTKQGLVSDLFSGDWPIARIGESATLITSGSRGWARYYSDEGAKFIRIGNLTRTHINLRFDSLVHVRVPSDGEGSRTSLQRDDLLISITADLGIIGVVPSDLGEAYINQHIALVRFNETEANSRWIGHYLSSALGRAQFSRLNDQGAKAGLNLPTISNLKFPAPASAVQRKVVAVLDALDDRITYAQCEVQKLQKQKQGLVSDLLTGHVRVPWESAL